MERHQEWVGCLLVSICAWQVSGCNSGLVRPTPQVSGSAPPLEIQNPQNVQAAPVSGGTGDWNRVPELPLDSVTQLPRRDTLPETDPYVEVQAGETLADVARRMGITAARLAEANGLPVTVQVTAGQLLYVPTEK